MLARTSYDIAQAESLDLGATWVNERPFTTERGVNTRFFLRKLKSGAAGRKRLLSAEVPVGSAEARDITVDEFDAEMSGRWNGTLPRTGRYQVCIGFRPSRAQATNTPITIKHAAGTAKLTLDQRTETTLFPFVPIGEFPFKAGNIGSVDLTNAGTDGRIAIEAVRWVWLGE